MKINVDTVKEATKTLKDHINRITEETFHTGFQSLTATPNIDFSLRKATARLK
jgi:hypothetical protein